MRAEGDWTQAGAPAVLAQAERYIAAGELDLSGVQRVDSAAVALLLELTRRARLTGKALRFTGMPSNLVTLVTFFGVDDILIEPAT